MKTTLNNRYGINNRCARLMRCCFQDTLYFDVYPDSRKKAAIKKLPKYVCP